MSKKRNFTSNDLSNDKNKKIKIDENLDFTSSNFLQKKVKVGDKFVSVVGYVETIHKLKKIKSKKSDSKDEFDLFKFVLNNNDNCRISCLSWSNAAFKFSNMIKENQKILFQNLTAKETSDFNDGNMSYELLLNNSSKLTLLGTFDILKEQNQIIAIEFNKENVLNSTGYIKIEGYLRDNFIPIKINSNNYFGSITNGEHKIIITIQNFSEECNFQQGQKLRIIGQLYENDDFSIAIQVQNEKQITILSNEPDMSLKLLLEGGELIYKS
ncbi:uncharacterized protein LOC127289361 [Leptopilina boulardi]|uniref:uncharacterized protein LOC127289361 n=1 Tax=Leptopilina boulardi TaxID=63433 RepID=UPI0021F58EF3|nr:uncharacterized protein LOC127289361 [Leptopilina boulardi]